MKKLLIICSSSFYDEIDKIKDQLMERFEVVFPNCYGEVVTNEDVYNMSEEEYYSFFKEMYNESKDKICGVDACLVLNFTKVKQGVTYNNYIGASTFLEMYEAFMNNKELYIFNDLPDRSNMLYDEIKGFNPIVLNGDISKIKD